MAKWLNKYEQGGLVLKKKTKDNYGTKPNLNDPKVSAGPNFVGEGYTAYNWKSPAWGGQFQHGGILGKTFLQPNDPKLPVGWNPKEKGYSTEYSTTIGTDGEYYLVPGFKHGKLLSDPEKEFRSTGELLGGPFKTIQSANDFANRRHKYVEKGQSLPSPMKTYDEFQMGGSMPGAVGFMYARTQNPAPSNGKYAKKTQASAQNGEEMKYYQDGLDFRPKSISQNGSSLDMNLFDLNTQAAQDATRNVIPRKMTAKEKKEAEAAGNAARKKSAEKAKAIVEERMKNRSSKADLNTPGSWHTEDKLRLFPESVGGLGEMYDEYINPGVIVGGMSDLLGESVAARNPVGVATALGVSAGLGALGVDPLGTALKYKNLGSNYLKGLRAQGHQVQGAQMFGGLADDFGRSMERLGFSEPEISRMYDELVDTRATNRIQNRIQPRQYNEPVPYQPPTDEELLAMNQVEANRYYRRPSQTQNVPDPNSFNWTPNSDIAERMRRSGEQIELRLARDLGIDESRLAAIRQQASDAYSNSSVRQQIADTQRRLAEADARRASGLGLPGRNNIDALRQENEEFARLIAPDAPEGAGAQEIEESFARSTPYIRTEPVSTPQQAGPTFGQKEYKMENFSPGKATYTDPSTGDTFSQDISYQGNDFIGRYNARGNRSSIEMVVNKPTTDPYLKVKDINFFSYGDFDNAMRTGTTRKLNKMMSSLPDKVDMDYINTSMYSQPIMNQQVARWANNKPGRIDILDVKRGNLNTLGRETPPNYAGTEREYYLDQLVNEFPNTERTYKTLAESTGYPFKEPTLVYDSPEGPQTLTYDQIKTPEFKQWYMDNGIDKYKLKINVDKYKLKKHWKQGGHIIDEMGQWAHPGEITTIPSNNITMKGVGYDVLGVSNTGDKKLMKPGKNYKFDGDYVTEYPKGGWLNKYK